jgi:elongation factor Ts
MEITAALVKELREHTGAGMMECKKALAEANGDLSAAADNLRKAGIVKAAKKSGRVAAEGAVAIATTADGATAVLVEVNSETDFVAKDAHFRAFVGAVATTAAAAGPDGVEALLRLPLQGAAESVEAARTALIAKVGENISVRRVTGISRRGDWLASYVHGGRIAVVLDMKGGDPQLARDIAMHVAAARPLCVSESEVAPEIIAKEREIFAAQAAESGKPPEIVEKMIGGRIKKFLEEVTLLGQPFVKDDSTTVGKLLKSRNAAVLGFTRFELGEGIEKKQADFAAEVMAQVRDSDKPKS